MKQKFIMISGYALLVSILGYSIYGMGKSLASGNFEYQIGESDHEEFENHNGFSSRKQNPVYLEECGSCHMAYPAQLLPSESWQKLMLGLEDHFGENAELDSMTSQTIENYLTHTSHSGSFKKLFRNLGNKSPIRITELPYFIHEHDEIPSRFIRGNDKVSSLSQCNACHQKAERGQFDEDDVIIPGFGRWDD